MKLRVRDGKTQYLSDGGEWQVLNRPVKDADIEVDAKKRQLVERLKTSEKAMVKQLNKNFDQDAYVEKHDTKRVFAEEVIECHKKIKSRFK